MEWMTGLMANLMAMIMTMTMLQDLPMMLQDCPQNRLRKHQKMTCASPPLTSTKKKATSYSVLLQNAETVRLVTDGSRTAVSVSAMKVGDSVLVHRLNGARHTGIAISEAGWEER